MTLLAVIVLLVLIATILGKSSKKEQRVQQEEMQKKDVQPKQKPVILIMIDSLMDTVLTETIHSGKTPALSFLKQNGQYFPQVVSSFPTMSVCIETTLLTGTPPNQHHIYGLVYFHKQEKRIINFGTGLREILTFGLRTVLRDSLMHLNQKTISRQVKTIHEETDQPTASINGLIYRGKYERKLFIPWIASMFGILPRQIPTRAPAFFSFAALSRIFSNTKYTSFWRRFGFNDSFTRMELSSLIENRKLPAFTIAYFPSNDDQVHKKGPSEISGIIQADKELQKILDAFGSWEEAIKKAVWIIMGDSGQTHILPDRQAAYIDLRQKLHSYRIMPIKQHSPREQDQLVLCVNERMAYIYILDPELAIVEVVNALQEEPKLDIISWKEKDWIYVVSGNIPGARCRFRKNGPLTDVYGQKWEMEGNPSVLDISVESDRMEYGIFPDVLFRLSGVMDTGERVIVVTVAPGYELTGESSPTHKGGAHGSLHYLDSNVPMIVCGTDSQPKTPRLVDLKDWILQLISP
ncbi:alkaline phosphatase family protein [Thermoactinomyces mirandus]|uniref:Alkaline phosphatase family protein n=1 Tax=Thermoactinomyces mirandus TaxID=2756294 RepID=A0A7W1XR43_9BACL|nr:alkaline phosphatase family protein [Thermoactinomyces mirandus]MBA4601709.1 alkaline phosphatase family protein [Thermoactinomyces mirandus]